MGDRKKVFSVDLLPNVPMPRKGSRDYAVRFQDAVNENNVITKKNIGKTHSAMYAAMIKGKVGSENDAGEFSQNGQQYLFWPDVIRSDKEGLHVDEIKSNCRRDSRPVCSPAQLGNYANNLLFRMDEGDRRPEANYVFFKYKNPPDGKVGNLKNGSLVEMLANQTERAVVVPLNMMFYLFRASPKIERDHSGSSFADAEGYDRAVYGRIPAGLMKTLFNIGMEGNARHVLDRIHESRINGLGNSPRGDNASWKNYVSGLIDNAKDFGLEKLCLDHLSVRNEMSHGNLHVRVKSRRRERVLKVKQFPVVVYENGVGNRKQQMWLKTFWDNNEEILKTLKLKNLMVSEDEDVPF